MAHRENDAAEAIRWDRILLAATAAACVASIIFILDHTKYPDPPWRLLVFKYLLREQDIAGSVFILCLAVAAYLPRTRAAVLDRVEWLGRNPWPVAAIAFVALCVAMPVVVQNHALAGDEHLALFQSRAFAAGRLTGQFPPDQFYRLIPGHYQWQWLITSESSGAVAAIYWPGFALLLVPFVLVGAPWACNPALASLSLVLIARVARQVTGKPEAGGWAVLFALGSPGFTLMALSYFSMTAQLFLNLLFAWLLLERTPARLVGAGVVGSCALVSGNPVPHLLFALPWVAWIARGPNARSALLTLSAGYAPISAVAGLGWWLFLRDLQGKIWFVPYSGDESAIHWLVNRLWYLLVELRIVFGLPDSDIVANRLAEQVRLWTWTVPGLPLLALAGWWIGRRNPALNLFAWSLASTLAGFAFVTFDQGYGWGARYVHSAWGGLPILAATAMVSLGDDASSLRLRDCAARVAVLSLIFATALRVFQIHLFIDEHLSLRPPFEQGVRQIVFITPNVHFYAQDFVQNDPFLRQPVIFMMSRGRKWDYEEVIRRYHPTARLTYDGPNGQVWRLKQ